MQSRLINSLLLILAIVSGIAMFVAIVNDEYTSLWFVSALFSFIVILFGWTIWNLLVFAYRAVRSKRSQNEQDDQTTEPTGSIPRSAPSLFVVFMFLWCLLYLSSLGCMASRQAANRSVCKNNIKQLGYALFNYHQAQGSFPPAYIADENGRPMHSWRVLLLPYLEGRDSSDLFMLYDFDEPWDGPNNRKLIDAKTQEYACCEDAYRSDKTSYVAILGADAAWRGDEPMTFDDMHGETSNTVLLIEVVDSDIAWTEPRDLSLDKLHKWIGPVSGTRISPKHRISYGFFEKPTAGGANILSADGSVALLPADQLTVETLKKTLAIGGCSKDLYDDWSSTGVNWWNCGVMLAFVLSVYLLLRRAANDDVSQTGGNGENSHVDQMPST